MANEKEFGQKMRQLGVLVDGIESMPDASSKAHARELVQLLMEVHGAALERMMELVFNMGQAGDTAPGGDTGQAGDTGRAGQAIIDKFGRDAIVRNLLLLYSLHPEDLATRVVQAIEIAGARLRKLDSGVELAGMKDGAVELRLKASSHTCGSTTKNLQSIVEESLYELAPDVTSLVFLGSAGEGASGFVPLEHLLKHPFAGTHSPVPPPASPLLAVHGAEMEGAD